MITLCTDSSRNAVSFRAWTKAWALLAVAPFIAGILVTPILGQTKIVASRIAQGLDRPVYATMAPGDASRLFIVEQHSGLIKVLNTATGNINAEPFLEISNLSFGNEQGLLGLAFAPDYQETGHFFVNYTDMSGRTHIERYTRSSADAAASGSAQLVLSYAQPQSNHNGGWMGFGPDNFLYIASGDGGGGNDDGQGHTDDIGNAQDITDNLLGKILRLDVAGATIPDDFPGDATRNYAIPASNPFVGSAGDAEIWAYGLRNPWRSSFDRQTGDFYIADVGQNTWEEINFQPATSPGGENYGWRLREGTMPNPSGAIGGPAPGAIDPIHEYPHTSSTEGGFSVTGGYVYRGPATPLQGHYFFADYVTNQIWSLRYDGQSVADFANRTPDIISTDGSPLGGISSFGEDLDGNLYVVSLDGDVFRFDDAFDVQPLSPAESRWKYLDNGSNQGTAWTSPSFDDSAWAEGQAQLGYGDGDEATVVSFGPSSSNRFVTTYFRRSFEVDDNARVAALVVDLLRDDGAAVYLNGQEIIRTDNLAPNATFNTLANFNGSPAVGGIDESRFWSYLIDPKLLREGENVLAVEVHQQSRTSSDLSFDLAVLADLLPRVGDYDRTDSWNADDIDTLADAIASGATENEFDLNDDGVVSQLDQQFWLDELVGVLPGDANVDGQVDELDYALFSTTLFSDNHLWSLGDFNLDGVTDGSDFNLWYANRGRSSPVGASHAVPEPIAIGWMGWLLAFGLINRARSIRCCRL